MRSSDLIRRLEDQPFQAFRIHLSDGTTIDVRKPTMVMVGLSSATLPTKFRKDDEGYDVVADWRTVALSHIVQFTALNGEPEGPGKKRKR